MGRIGLFLFISIFTFWFWTSQAKADPSVPCNLEYGKCITNSDGSNWAPSTNEIPITTRDGYSNRSDEQQMSGFDTPPSAAGGMTSAEKALQHAGEGGSAAECSAEASEARDDCGGSSTQALMAVVQQFGSAASQSAMTANAAATAQRLQGLTAASSTMTLGLQCYNAAKACEATCKGESQKKGDRADVARSKCATYKTNILVQMGGSLSQLMLAMANAAAIRGQLNSNPGGIPTPGNPAFPTTPSTTLASTTTGNLDPGPTTNPTDPAAFNGYDSKAGAGKYASNDVNGSGGGAGGSPYPGGAPMGMGGAGGGAGSGFKDPDHGLNGGGGSGYSVSGVATTGGGGGGFPGGRSRSGDEKLDLSKFLPGGSMDPAKRGLASTEQLLQAQGITGANDLSNFEKITRAMNRKRAVLKQ